MALNKRQYTDGQTIITASNLNEIQDCIITIENNYVPKTRTVAGKALSSNITLAASDVGAVPTSRTINSKALTGNITLSAADVGAVPVARTVNGKALSSNITLNAADVSAVPTTRKVNNKALSADISLAASDVGAVPTSRTVNGKALSSNITLTSDDIGQQITVLSSGADLNTLYGEGATGLYYVQSGVSNTPTTWKILLVVGYGTANAFQYMFGGKCVYVRERTGSTPTWSAWTTPYGTFCVEGTTLASKTNTTFCTTAAHPRITANTKIAKVTFLNPSCVISNFTATTNANGTVTLSGTTSSSTTTAIIECYD